MVKAAARKVSREATDNSPETVSKPWMLAGLEVCFAYAYAVASLERGNGEALLFI